jgi:hypothetical protein
MSNTVNSFKKELKSILLQNTFHTVEEYSQIALQYLGILVTGVNKYNYPCVCNFMYCCSHVMDVDCGMYMSDLCILLLLLAGMHIVVACPVLCNVTQMM